MAHNDRLIPPARFLCVNTKIISKTCLLAIVLVVAGCRDSAPVPTAGNDVGNPDEDRNVETADGIISRNQARRLGSFEFINQDGEQFTQDAIASRLVVVNFIFTTCPGTCPRQSAAMKTLQDRIEKADSSGAVRLISISVQPEVDTPEVLSAYASEYGANPDIWSFLTGEKDAIWSFSKDALSMQVAPNPGDPLIPIAHESKFALIDRTGKIRGYFDALEEQGFEQLWSAIDTVLPEFEPAEQMLQSHGLSGDIGHMAQPAGILETDWLDVLAQQELDALKALQAIPTLRFTECVESTGITFVPQIVDDQRHRLLVNHYDHGNSLSVADVDNDGLLDLYFVSQVGPNELWRCTGDGRFENVTDSAGVGLADRVCVAASFCDTDNDGDADLFVTTIRNGNVFLQNDGSGRFTDITADSGLAYSGHSSKGTFFDYDRDGLADLYLCNVGKFTTEEHVLVRRDLCNSQPDTEVKYFVGRGDAFSGHLVPELSEHSVLYRNMGKNRFEDVTSSVGMENDSSWSGDAIVFDANNDHWPDLYVCNMQGHDRLYINQEGQTFSDQTTEFFKATPWGTMGASVFDFDNNGLFDLYLTDMHSDMSKDIGPELEKEKSDMTWPETFLKSEGRSIYGNAFYKQTDSGRFEEVSDSIGAENYWPWGLSYGDFDADGYQDAFLCSSMCFPYRYSTNSLLLNSNGERFLDAQFTVGIEPRKRSEMIAPWFSVDFSGADSENKLRQGRDGTHVIWSATGTRSCAVIDFDNDGDLDIVTNEFNTHPQVFRSNLNDENKASYLKVMLVGTTSSRNALGAVVVVETKNGAQRQLNNGASGYLSQSIMPLYFGLGDSTSAERITVIWPSGEQQTLDGPIMPNQLVEITEDSAGQ